MILAEWVLRKNQTMMIQKITRFRTALNDNTEKEIVKKKKKKTSLTLPLVNAGSKTLVRFILFHKKYVSKHFLSP